MTNQPIEIDSTAVPVRDKCWCTSSPSMPVPGDRRAWLCPGAVQPDQAALIAEPPYPQA
jgi:hypothetical protein